MKKLLLLALTINIMFPLRVDAQSVESIKKLNVPFFRQEQRLSCEVATLRMALAHQGVVLPEKTLINLLAFDTTPRTSNTWGNPYRGFVGKINGSMGGTGYGVYWQPIADLASRYRRAHVIENSTIHELTENVDAGRPIIIWGYYGKGTPISWSTPDGETISAINGEHTRVVIGYKGSPYDPEGFYLIDPLTGPLYWTKDQLLKNWSVFSNSGVVVYPQPQLVKTPDNSTVWEISPEGTTKQALAMTWETFLDRKYNPLAIVIIDEKNLEKFSTGEMIF